MSPYFSENPFYYEILKDRLLWDKLSLLRRSRFQEKVLAHSEFRKLHDFVAETDWPIAENVDFSKSEVQIGSREELLNDQASDSLKLGLQKFSPWKKGPFNIFGHSIDAEWRSDWKWQRIKEVAPPLNGKVVADIGCSNGYFMFRMLAEEPAAVIGMDPYAKAMLNFSVLKQMSGIANADFDLIGAEHAELFPDCFDVIFCLGVVYHHTDPMQLLRSMYKSLKKGGTLIIESQGIPGELPLALTPRQRYAKARGIWFLPTQSCLENWLRRAQFQKVECFYNETLSCEEQRRSKWADVDSLKEFLKPDDPSQTIEGYPAPRRIYFICKKT